MPLEGLAQFAARLAAIGEEVAQPWKPVADGLEPRRCAVAILPIGRMNKDEEHDAQRVSDDGALAAVDLFPASQPERPPLSVVFTLWLSITPAVGLASRPSSSRALMTSSWLMVSHKRLSRQS